MIEKRKYPVMGYAQHQCSCENVIVRYPKKAIEYGAKKQQKDWIKKVKASPDLQVDYDPETGFHK